MSEFCEIEPNYWEELLRVAERDECQHVAQELVKIYSDPDKFPEGVPKEWNGKARNPYLEDYFEVPFAFVQVGRLRNPSYPLAQSFDETKFNENGERLWRLRTEGSTMTTGIDASKDLKALGDQMSRQYKEPIICQKITKYSEDTTRVFNTFVFKRVTKLGGNEQEYQKKGRLAESPKWMGKTAKVLDFHTPLPPAKEVDAISKAIVAEVNSENAGKRRKPVENPYAKKRDSKDQTRNIDTADNKRKKCGEKNTAVVYRDEERKESETNEAVEEEKGRETSDVFEDCVEVNGTEVEGDSQLNSEAPGGVESEESTAIAVPYRARRTKKWQDIGRLDPKVRHLLTPEKERYVQQVVTCFFNKKNAEQKTGTQDNQET
jgi:hypothetical protein